tara:strand:- start:5084 stop:5320 length:237 start_codon:yes stop_codon:yes gene_type:complete
MTVVIRIVVVIVSEMILLGFISGDQFSDNCGENTAVRIDAEIWALTINKYNVQHRQGKKNEKLVSSSRIFGGTIALST